MKAKLALLLLIPALAFAQVLPNFSGATTDVSGSISTGGSYQTVLPSVGVRHSLEFYNICWTASNCTATTDICWLHIGSDSATSANSYPIGYQGGYVRLSGPIPNDAIQVTCTSTGDKFVLKVQ